MWPQELQLGENESIPTLTQFDAGPDGLTRGRDMIHCHNLPAGRPGPEKRRVVRVAELLLLLALALGGCTVGATTTTSTSLSSGVVVAAKAASDVGVDRPLVTHDGLMVRRRVVIAIQPTRRADLVFLRRKMDDAAARLRMTLSAISPKVLDPATLERLAPELAVVLPAGKTVADAKRLIDPASAEGRRLREVAEYKVASVLVHDLRFTAPSARPVLLANAIAREGILPDALANYVTTLGRGKLDISYTGPLLSDALVESVRAGIARPADIQPAAVTISPRSTTGVGVDMAKEPAKAVLVAEVSTAHNQGAVLPVALPAAGGSLQSSLWPLSVVSVSLLLILTLVVLRLRRFKRADQT